MKIGILTFTDGTNIGQRLQNYALQETLKKLGVDEVYTIEQTSPYSVKHRVNQSAKNVLDAFTQPKRFLERRKREKYFSKFNREQIKFYADKLKFEGSNEEIKKYFDAFIVGSDQVWNPKSPYVGKNFFLTFADREQRYTYAPSFSIGEIPDQYKDKYISYLKGFNALSVREEQGATIIKKLTGMDASVVLDPTLLLSKAEWDTIKSEYIGKPQRDYVLKVILGTDSNEINTELFGIEEQVYINNDSNISPSTFLDLISHAKLVVTDSYHITIFSIIYHRPFINVSRKGTNNDMSSRFDTLYQKLGISNRNWVYLQDHLGDVLDYDYCLIDKKIEEERRQAFALLGENLIGITRNKKL